MEEWLLQIAHDPGPWAFSLILLSLLLNSLGLPLPEEIPIAAAGYLVYLGTIDFTWGVSLVTLAVLTGDSMLFGIGRYLGNRIFDIGFFSSFLTPKRMRKANRLFRRYGNGVVFVARFIAGARGTIFLTAGILKMPYRRFILMDGMAAMISVPLQIFIFYRFGEEIQQGIKTIHHAGEVILGVFILVILSLFGWKYFKKRKRILQAEKSTQENHQVGQEEAKKPLDSAP